MANTLKDVIFAEIQDFGNVGKEDPDTWTDKDTENLPNNLCDVIDNFIAGQLSWLFEKHMLQYNQ